MRLCVSAHMCARATMCVHAPVSNIHEKAGLSHTPPRFLFSCRELHPTDIIFGGHLENWKDRADVPERRSILHAKGIVRLSLSRFIVQQVENCGIVLRFLLVERVPHEPSSCGTVCEQEVHVLQQMKEAEDYFSSLSPEARVFMLEVPTARSEGMLSRRI
jgi:hypothetical protein